MLTFKKFNPDNFKTDVSGHLVSTKVLFINNSTVMLGELKENRISSSDYYISADGEIFTTDDQTLVCEVKVEDETVRKLKIANSKLALIETIMGEYYTGSFTTIEEVAGEISAVVTGTED